MGKRRRVIDVDVYEEDVDSSLHSKSINEDMGRERKQSSSREEERVSRRKSRRSNHEEDVERNNSPNFDLGNIDMNQIASMLGNVDMNQLGSLLGTLGGTNQGGQGVLDGLGALAGAGAGQGLLGSLGSLLGSGGLQGILGNLGGLAGMFNKSGFTDNEDPDYKDLPIRGDRGVEILWALRPLVTPERAQLIEMVVQLYAIGKILKGTFY